jgi:hypothetical protein
MQIRTKFQPIQTGTMRCRNGKKPPGIGQQPHRASVSLIASSCQRDWMVNARCVARLFSRWSPWAGMAMEMMMSEYGARMLRDENNQISSNEDK